MDDERTVPRVLHIERDSTDEVRQLRPTTKVGKCPLWGLTNAMEKKPGNDRCNRGCQLYMDEVGECAIVVLARRGSG